MLLLNGPCGVGKTTLAEAIADMSDGPRAFFDLDALTRVWPHAPDDRFGQGRAQRMIARLLPELPPGCPLILAHVWETAADLSRLRAALPDAVFTHVVLTAPLAVIDARLAGRERGESLAWHRARARVLDEILRSGPSRDLTLDTADSDPVTLARSVLDATGWPAATKGRP